MICYGVFSEKQFFGYLKLKYVVGVKLVKVDFFNFFQM